MKSLLFLLLPVYSQVYAANFTYTIVHPPGAANSSAQGINDRGVIVGSYGSGVHAYKLDGDSYTRIDYPASSQTSATGINNSSHIVGHTIAGPPNYFQGFQLADNAFYSINVPGALETAAFGINDRGQIVGHYRSAETLKVSGFILDGADYATIHFPGSSDTLPTGVNNRGDIVGHYYNAHAPHTERGFLYSDGTYYPLDHPDAVNEMHARGINDRGQIVGNYRGADNIHYGFVYANGIYDEFRYPGSFYTIPSGINNHGQIVGTVLMPVTGQQFGFLAEEARSRVPEQGNAAIALFIAVGILVIARHKGDHFIGLALSKRLRGFPKIGPEARS